MAVNDRYELIDDQLLYAQACLNVYFYRQISGAAGSAEDLVNAWLAAILPSVRGNQGPQLTHVIVRARNVDNPADFFISVRVPPDAGTLLGECLPPFVTWGFKLGRVTLAVRNGQKRFSGVPEDGLNGLNPTPGAQTSLVALAQVLDDDLTGASAAVYEPRITRRVFNPVTGITTYTDFAMGLASFTRVSTQNTRKVGRGI